MFTQRKKGENLMGQEEHKGYYVIRHKASGELMPQMKRGRGYSHWHPGVNPLPSSSDNIPRIVHSLGKANRCISQWNTYPNGRTTTSQSYHGDIDIFTDFKPDSRKKEDLEVVEIILKLVEESE